MPKIRKVKRRKSYKVNINRKRLRDKLRKLPAIECKDIKEAWEDTKSIRHNLSEMGLAYNANEILKIPNFKREILSEARPNAIEDSSESDEESQTKNVPPKLHIALNLEAEAKAPREKRFRLPNQQVQFVTYLMDKYGDDYKAMSRDKKNHYQLTWRQIRAKINTFKSIPEQYAEYLLKKGEIVLDNPETLLETKKRMAKENVAKYCAPKPKKVKQTSQWLEESIEEFDTGDKLENIEDGSNETTNNVEKKLKLFSDDESEDELAEKEAIPTKSGSQSEKGRKEANDAPIKKISSVNGKKLESLEKLESSDSEEELEGGETDEEAGFVNLDDMSDEALSDDDILDNGEFVTDSEEESN